MASLLVSKTLQMPTWNFETGGRCFRISRELSYERLSYKRFGVDREERLLGPEGIMRSKSRSSVSVVNCNIRVLDIEKLSARCTQGPSLEVWMWPARRAGIGWGKTLIHGERQGPLGDQTLVGARYHDLFSELRTLQPWKKGCAGVRAYERTAAVAHWRRVMYDKSDCVAQG